MKSSPVFFFLFLYGIRTEEVATPSSLLAPRNFNHHAYAVNQYLKSLKKPDPTKQGPVLFPNDGPPSPRPPLVVTSRPLIESIAKSDLNPVPFNNSVAEQSQLNQVTYKPDYLRFQYQPVYPVAIPDYDLTVTNRVPYADIVNKVRGQGIIDNRYNNYEERTSLPPIYKALSDYAQKKVLQTNHKPEQYDYKKIVPEYGRSYETNELPDENDNSNDYNQGENYAFAYTVKDVKTGDDFSHRQQSSGSATNGEYRVRLPDGRMQIVSYTADENGYKADVRYDNDVPSNTHVDTKHDYKQIDYKDVDYKYNENRKDVNDYSEINIKNNPVNYNYKTNVDNDYTQRDFKIKPVKEDYASQYDTSKEFYNDYSLEYPTKYDHQSKFALFKPTTTHASFTTVRPSYEEIKDIFTRKPYDSNTKYDHLSKFALFKPTTTHASFTTVRPSYEEIKDLFTRKPYDPNANYISDRAVEINAPSTPNYGGGTEDVVVIAPKLYTHIRSSTPFADTIVTTPKPFIVTPASYLASTIATLKERIKSSKPILSRSFLDRINKYLTFN